MWRLIFPRFDNNGEHDASLAWFCQKDNIIDKLNKCLDLIWIASQGQIHRLI